MAETKIAPIAHNEETLSEAELLILCLRGSPFSVPVSIDWLALLRLAEKHSVLPLMSEALIANGAEMPAFFLQAVDGSRTGTMLLAVELEHLLAKFAGHKIEVIPLKGPLLAEVLYGDITMRPFADLDLLVRDNDFGRAELLLQDAGWVARSAARRLSPRFFARRHAGRTSLRHRIATIFPFRPTGSMGPINCEHVSPSADTSHVRERSRASSLPARMKHGFGKLLWVADLRRALTLASERNPQELVNRAREHGLEQVLHISCAMVLEVFPQQLPADLGRGAGGIAPMPLQVLTGNLQRLLVGSATNTSIPELWSFSLQGQAYPLQRWARRWKALAPTSQDNLWAEDHRFPRTYATVATVSSAREIRTATCVAGHVSALCRTTKVETTIPASSSRRKDKCRSGDVAGISSGPAMNRMRLRNKQQERRRGYGVFAVTLNQLSPRGRLMPIDSICGGLYRVL